MKILAIESSADETGISIVDACGDVITVRKNLIASQIEMHREYGGIVPNLAGKFHAQNIMPLLHEADIDPDSVDLIAVTAGPGLMPCLVVGVSAANALAYSWDKPLVGVHHIEGHIYANWITQDKPTFPALALVVSGGHTQLMLMRDHFDYEIIGQTQDDAVGEAYDKAARLMGLPYPGGPEIDRRAHSFVERFPDDTDAYELLPRPMRNSCDYHFSFSGLKTAVLYSVRKYQKSLLITDGAVDKSIRKTDFDSVTLPTDFVDRMCYAFQSAAVDVLIHKTIRAAQEHNVCSILLAGGVSANKALRTELQEAVSQLDGPVSFHVPDFEYCLDNGAMIAVAAAYRWDRIDMSSQKDCHKTVLADPNFTINDFQC